MPTEVVNLGSKDGGSPVGGLPEAPESDLPPGNNVPFLQRCDWLSFWIAWVLTLGVYLCTLAPEVTLRFSGLLATSAEYAGVPHPPGFPLWTVYAWLFAKLLPFCNVAWRVAVSSAVAGAVASGVIAMLVSSAGARMLEQTKSLPRLGVKAAQQLRVLAGVVAGTIFGLSGSVWSQAVVVESWTLGLMLFSLVIGLLAAWAHSPNHGTRLYGACFVFGLAFATNQGFAVAILGLELLILFIDPRLGRDFLLATAAILLAAILAHGLSLIRPPAGRIHGLHWAGLYGIWRGVRVVGAVAAVGAAIGTVLTRGLLGNWRALLGGLFGLALGLSVYLYPPIASMTNPPVNWAYPRTVEGFFHLITRGQYEQMEPVTSVADFSDQTVQFGGAAAKDYGIVAVLFAVVPFWHLLRLSSAQRRWMLGLLALFLCLSLFLLAMQNPSLSGGMSWVDLLNPYFAFSYLIVAIWTGYGALLLGARIMRA